VPSIKGNLCHIYGLSALLTGSLDKLNILQRAEGLKTASLFDPEARGHEAPRLVKLRRVGQQAWGYTVRKWDYLEHLDEQNYFTHLQPAR